MNKNYTEQERKDAVEFLQVAWPVNVDDHDDPEFRDWVDWRAEAHQPVKNPELVQEAVTAVLWEEALQWYKEATGVDLEEEADCFDPEDPEVSKARAWLQRQHPNRVAERLFDHQK